MSDFGYHTQFIPKGEYGEFSKVEEEFEELKDAWLNRESSVLSVCELSDLYGAMEAFAEITLHMPMSEVIKFSELTKEVYQNRPQK
jgi:hypothetical protein